MDSGIQLAVIEKLRSLTSEEGLHVLCPPTPPVYGMADLDAIGRGGATAEELARESAWIRSVNVVPGAGSLAPAEPSFLWERLSDLRIQPAEFALPVPGDGETSELDAARALLYKNPDDSVRQFSDAYLAYQQYQHLHESAVTLFHQRRQECEGSPDPAAAEFWAQVAAPTYKAEIEQAMFKWRELGRKDDVERAQQTINAAAEREPENQWHKWMAQYSADVDNRSDLNLLNFVPTSFSPANIGSIADWPETVLDAPQIAALGAAAPADLRSRFGGTPSDALRVSFEYARLSIERAWFPRRAFTARFWRLRGPGPTWSDGGSPPAGHLPGYIVSALLVRNLSVVLPGGSGPGWPRHAREIGELSDLVVRKIEPASPVPPLAGRRDHRGVVRAARRGRPAMAATVRDAAVAPQLPDPSVVLAARKTGGNFPSRITRASAEFGELGKVDRDLRQKMLLLRQPAILTAPAPTRTESVIGPHEACVVAYLWKAFPKYPDPDPGLRWPA